jgi:hypothetical protein
MTLSTLLLCFALGALIIALPLIVLICRIALDSPVFGAVLAAGVLIGAYFRIPDDCPVGQHCGVRLEMTVFLFVLAVGVAFAVATLAGFVRVLRSRSSGPVPLPRARVRRGL